MRVLTLFLCLTATSTGQPRFEHIWGRITAIDKSGFEIDQNFNADPQSAYRRRKRLIVLNSSTAFRGSARGDLRVGRIVDIIGRERNDTSVQATRVIVYEGNAPVRMRSGEHTTATDGRHR